MGGGREREVEPWEGDTCNHRRATSATIKMHATARTKSMGDKSILDREEAERARRMRNVTTRVKREEEGERVGQKERRRRGDTNVSRWLEIERGGEFG